MQQMTFIPRVEEGNVIPQRARDGYIVGRAGQKRSDLLGDIEDRARERGEPLRGRERSAPSGLRESRQVLQTPGHVPVVVRRAAAAKQRQTEQRRGPEQS